MLLDYLKIIQERENLHGKQNEEVEKDILRRYFRKYEFSDKREAEGFFIAWGVLPETPEAEPVLEYCANALGEKYNLDVSITGLLLEVKPRGNVYSYRNGEWHEGYDPFYGDTNHCYGDTLEEAIKSLYVKDTNHNWPLKKTDKIGLITNSCGYGKTHWVEHELVDEINDIALIWNDLSQFTHYEKKDILFISTRRSIVDQQLKNGEVENANEDDFSASGLNPLWEERGNKVRIISTAKLGSLYKEGKIERMFPIVVIDELHSLFLDTMFSEESYYAIECLLNDFWKDTIKIGLTATPNLLFNYIDKEQKLFYALDNCVLPPKYNAEEVLYYNHTYLAKTLKTLTPTADNKVLVYCPSAKSAIGFAEKEPQAAYLISNYNKNIEAVEKQQPLYKYIIENAKLPEEVNILFMTSAYREGVEIKDSAVKTVVIDASDDITISQFIGRIRSDIKKVIINTNKNQEDRIKANADLWNELKDKTYEDWAEQFGRQLAKAERNENTTLLIQKMKGKYELNKFFLPIHLYLLDCYIQANNEEERKLIRVGDRDLVGKDDYFGSYLKRYSKTPIRNADMAIESANWQAVEEYLNQKLYKEDKDNLCALIDWRNKENRLIKWTKVKQELIKRGYKVEDKVSGNKRYTIINK